MRRWRRVLGAAVGLALVTLGPGAARLPGAIGKETASAGCASRAILSRDASAVRRSLLRLAGVHGASPATLAVAQAVRTRWRRGPRLSAARRELAKAEARVICVLRVLDRARRSSTQRRRLRAISVLSSRSAVEGLSARQLAYMDVLWALQAHRMAAQHIALAAARQAELCYGTSNALLTDRHPAVSDCVTASPGLSPRAAETENRACASGSTLPVWVNRTVPKRAQGKVLAGAGLRSQVVHRPIRRLYPGTNPLADHYPDGRLPTGPPQWRNLAGVPPSAIVHATSANAIFNAPGSRYRIAFNFSHYGGAPVNIGDFSANGADDLAISDHYSYVDGMPHAGEVDVYSGHRGREITPRSQAPGIIFYGDRPRAKLGLTIAGAGDVNGDGWPDLLVAAAFRSTDHGRIPNGGAAYLIYGGFLQQFRCTVKVRVQDIGRTIPGFLIV